MQNASFPLTVKRCKLCQDDELLVTASATIGEQTEPVAHNINAAKNAASDFLQTLTTFSFTEINPPSLKNKKSYSYIDITAAQWPEFNYIIIITRFQQNEKCIDRNTLDFYNEKRGKFLWFVEMQTRMQHRMSALR